MALPKFSCFSSIRLTLRDAFCCECSRLVSPFSAFLLASILFSVGCEDDTELVRQIQNRRQEKQQLQSDHDHLGESFNLLRKYIELDAEKAQRQIAYHLNRWAESRPDPENSVPKIAKSIRDLISAEQLQERMVDETFQSSDAIHLRDCFLFNSLCRWVDVESHQDPLLADWIDSMSEKMDAETIQELKTATRLFDWTIRNIALEPTDLTGSAPPGPAFPLGMQFLGPGYRQTDYQTLMRGIGDGLQRAGVFTQLCAQAGIPSAVLGTIDSTDGSVTPFCVGVLINQDVYLFEPTLGVHVPGPDQVGIATLAQARRDAVILRRLGIAGLDQFTYEVTKADIQQCVAMLNLLPEAISPRMQKLQSGLTGDRRMTVYVDADQLAEDWDAVTGISGVRIWDVPLKAEVYRQVCDAHAQRDPMFQFWYVARWAMMDAQSTMAELLSKARWRHLIGQITDIEEEGIEGARTLYLEQRKPEFELEDLRIDVELQKQYGIRRELGIDSQTYDQQVAQVQTLMRMGKRTATYWLSLLQADDGRAETAKSWIEKRVLDDQQQSFWIPSARYNLARLHELLGDHEAAIDLYKREGEPQEHGNRIRARLLSKSLE